MGCELRVTVASNHKTSFWQLVGCNLQTGNFIAMYIYGGLCEPDGFSKAVHVHVERGWGTWKNNVVNKTSNSGTYMYVPSIDDNAFNFLTFKNYPNHEVS